MKKFWIVLLVLILCVVSIVGAVGYFESFEHARWVGDWKRVPLDYPYHLVDYGDESGVMLQDWRVYTREKERDRSDVDVESLTFEQECLLSLKCVVRFGHGNGYCWGVRNLSQVRSDGTLSAPRWFILRLGEARPWYTDSEAAVEERCTRLGLDVRNMRTFEKAWARR